MACRQIQPTFETMEIESKTGSKIRLQEPSKTIDFGRGLGFNSTDRAVSRCHVSFKLHEDRTSVYFEVKGKNPIWVRDHTNDEIRVYKASEKGEIKSGDSFCLSSKHPVWFNVKAIANEDEDDDESKSEIGYDEAFAEISAVHYGEVESCDLSQIDPVKEFSFVVMGHEFDFYPKKMIRDIRNWDWFLVESKEDSDEDETSDRKVKKGTRKKRKKGKQDDDDDVWTGESEEDAELIKKLRNDPKPKYSTRSKKQARKKKGASATASKSSKDGSKRYATVDEEEDEEEDENDETLGGFIVDDEELGEENEYDDEEEDEEEFEDDEEDE